MNLGGGADGDLVADEALVEPGVLDLLVEPLALDLGFPTNMGSHPLSYFSSAGIGGSGGGQRGGGCLAVDFIVFSQ